MTPPQTALVIDLACDLDLSVAGELKDQLLDAVHGDSDLVVDASSVERLTTPCVQILIAAARSLTEQGSGLVLKSPSEPFVSAFSDLGLSAVMQQWVETK